MYYEINIAKMGKDRQYHHYFATAKRSLDNLDEAKQMVKVFMEKFPEPKFKIGVSYYKGIVEGWDAYEFINK